MAAYIGNKRFQLTTALNGLGGPAKWGDITGQISAQADLQKEFQEVSALIMTEGIQQLNGIVKNGKMTIYQGTVEKGQFSANQSSDLSIFLDPPSPGGGGDIPADLSCNNLSVGTSVSFGLGSVASGEYGSIAQGAYSKATANAAVALGSECSATSQMSYAIGYRANAMHNNSMVISLCDNSDILKQSNSQNSLNLYVGNGTTGNALDNVRINNESLEGFITTYSRQFLAILYDINNSTQTGNYIQVGGTIRQWNKGIFCFEVEAEGGFPIKYNFQNPLTYHQEEIEYYLSPTYSNNSERCGAVITVPCALDSPVTIYNDNGYDMTVRVFYRIEIKDLYDN